MIWIAGLDYELPRSRADVTASVVVESDLDTNALQNLTAAVGA